MGGNEEGDSLLGHRNRAARRAQQGGYRSRFCSGFQEPYRRAAGRNRCGDPGASEADRGFGETATRMLGLTVPPTVLARAQQSERIRRIAVLMGAGSRSMCIGEVRI